MYSASHYVRRSAGTVKKMPVSQQRGRPKDTICPRHIIRIQSRLLNSNSEYFPPMYLTWPESRTVPVALVLTHFHVAVDSRKEAAVFTFSVWIFPMRRHPSGGSECIGIKKPAPASPGQVRHSQPMHKPHELSSRLLNSNSEYLSSMYLTCRDRRTVPVALVLTHFHAAIQSREKTQYSTAIIITRFLR